MSRRMAALLTTVAVAGGSVGAIVPAASFATTQKKHCIKYKTYKKHGHKYKRCAKYSKH